MQVETDSDQSQVHHDGRRDYIAPEVEVQQTVDEIGVHGENLCVGEWTSGHQSMWSASIRRPAGVADYGRSNPTAAASSACGTLFSQPHTLRRLGHQLTRY